MTMMMMMIMRADPARLGCDQQPASRGSQLATSGADICRGSACEVSRAGQKIHHRPGPSAPDLEMATVARPQAVVVVVIVVDFASARVNELASGAQWII